MKNTILQCILTRRTKSCKTSETGKCQNGNEASISRSIASVEKATMRPY